jgi:hypothetical protein
MCYFSRLGRRAALAVSLCVLPSLAYAQAAPLKAPTIAATVAAAADWASTYHALKYYEVREVNPLLQGLDHAPGRMISLGAVMDAGMISAWNLTMGRSRPRVAAAGLWGMTAFRSYLALHNFLNERKAGRRDEDRKPGLISAPMLGGN